MILYGRGAAKHEFPRTHSHGFLMDLSLTQLPQLCGLKKLWLASVLVRGLTQVWANCVVISRGRARISAGASSPAQ
jgi:hypothetical protein